VPPNGLEVDLKLSSKYRAYQDIYLVIARMSQQNIIRGVLGKADRRTWHGPEIQRRLWRLITSCEAVLSGYLVLAF
jgi:hypothetical protein